jgi:galactose mutarotase-like enzyme
MGQQSWTITDVESGVNVEQLELTRREIKRAPASFQVSKQTLRGGLQDGVDLLTVNNGKVSIDIVPTRGMSLWQASIDGDRIGWRSPVRGPVHPKFVDLGEPSGLGWLDGFDELMVRCGLESNGAPEFDDKGILVYPLHGRIGNRPAQHVSVHVDDDEGMILVRGVVEETRFHFLKLRLVTELRTRFGETAIHIHDRVENISASPATVQMLYHTNFGLPLLDAGAQLVAPVKAVAPRNDHAAEGMSNWSSYSAPEAGFEEQVYFLELLADEDKATRMMLKNAHGTRGVSLQYNTSTLPCFTVWKNTTAGEDGCVTGLEPGTNYPNPRSFEGEQGRVAELEAGGHVDFEFGIAFQQTADEVQGVEQVIQELQGDHVPTVYDAPRSGWNPDEVSG